MVPQAMIWVMPSTDTARQGPTNMSRRLGMARAVFTERASKASEHDPEKRQPVSRLREARFGGRRKVGSDHALTKKFYAATLVSANAGTFAAKRSSQVTSLGCAARQSPA